MEHSQRKCVIGGNPTCAEINRLCAETVVRPDDVKQVETALEKAERVARPNQLPVVVWAPNSLCRSHALVVLRWSDFLICLGEAQPRRNHMLEDLEKRAAAGDTVAYEELAVLAPDRLPRKLRT
jgi:hypothetical protein